MATGIDELRRTNFAVLKGMRIGLLTNHTGRARDGSATVDLLAAAPAMKLVALFSPEHGIRGILDARVPSTTDEKTGLPIHSLYGESRRPTTEMLTGLVLSQIAREGAPIILGILPTGTGKSVCYQIPALSKFDKTGALTVVISPLVALMADQVQGMARAGISSAVTVNGMLSLPERQDAMDKVRMGEAAMLLISPEQLRSVSVRSVLAQERLGSSWASWSA